MPFAKWISMMCSDVEIELQNAAVENESLGEIR